MLSRRAFLSALAASTTLPKLAYSQSALQAGAGAESSRRPCCGSSAATSR